MKCMSFAPTVVLLTLLAAATARFETDAVGKKNTPEWTEAVNGLQCRIVAQKDEYTLGDPIMVDFELRNVSPDTLLVYQGYHTEMTTSFDIRASDGEKAGYRGYVSGVGLRYPTVLPGTNDRGAPPPALEAVPARDRTGHFKCGKSFDLGYEYGIVKPGRYTITATFRSEGQRTVYALDPRIEAEGIAVWSGELTSNTIEIDVAPEPVAGDIAEPTTASERAGGAPPKVRCFYDASHSYSSRPTALNGAMFAKVVEEAGKWTCHVVFYYQSKFYECTVFAAQPDGQKTGVFEGNIAIADRTIPLRLEFKDTAEGVFLHGQIGDGLDKGIVVLQEMRSP